MRSTRNLIVFSITLIGIILYFFQHTPIVKKQPQSIKTNLSSLNNKANTVSTNKKTKSELTEKPSELKNDNETEAKNNRGQSVGPSDRERTPMTQKNYRVIQWCTGVVGKAALQHFIENPIFELVGVLVTNPEKVGKDAGELVGLSPTGVADYGHAAFPRFPCSGSRARCQGGGGGREKMATVHHGITQRGSKRKFHHESIELPRSGSCRQGEIHRAGTRRDDVVEDRRPVSEVVGFLDRLVSRNWNRRFHAASRQK